MQSSDLSHAIWLVTSRSFLSRREDSDDTFSRTPQARAFGNARACGVRLNDPLKVSPTGNIFSGVGPKPTVRPLDSRRAGFNGQNDLSVTGILVSAPKGRDSIAQGNALGWDTKKMLQP